MFHLISIFIWNLTDSVKIEKQYTIVNNKKQEYNSCRYPPSQKIR